MTQHSFQTSGFRPVAYFFFQLGHKWPMSTITTPQLSVTPFSPFDLLTPDKLPPPRLKILVCGETAVTYPQGGGASMRPSYR
jgi:hypothetical protein